MDKLLLLLSGLALGARFAEQIRAEVPILSPNSSAEDKVDASV